MDPKNNYERINNAIKQLESIDLNSEFKFKEFWENVTGINNLFKNLKPLQKEEREHLWERLTKKCNEVKKLQKKRNDNVLYDSKHKRDIIESMIRSALLYDFSYPENVKKANEGLAKALLYMKDGWQKIAETFILEGLEGWSGKMTKTDSEACWKLWKKAKDTVKQKQKDIWYGNYLINKERIIGISDLADYGSPFEAINLIIELQKNLRAYPMEDVYWNEIKNSIHDCWQKAQKRINEQKSEKRLKHAIWKGRSEDALANFTNLIEKNENIISRIQSQIDDLEYKADSARTDEFRDTVRGWIEEKKDKIKDIMRTNMELENKISDIRKQLYE